MTTLARLVLVAGALVLVAGALAYSCSRPAVRVAEPTWQPRQLEVRRPLTPPREVPVPSSPTTVRHVALPDPASVALTALIEADTADVQLVVREARPVLFPEFRRRPRVEIDVLAPPSADGGAGDGHERNVTVLPVVRPMVDVEATLGIGVAGVPVRPLAAVSLVRLGGVRLGAFVSGGRPLGAGPHAGVELYRGLMLGAGYDLAGGRPLLTLYHRF